MEKVLNESWKQWIAECVVKKVSRKKILEILKKRGYCLDESKKELELALNHPYIKGAKNLRKKSYLENDLKLLEIEEKINSLYYDKSSIKEKSVDFDLTFDKPKIVSWKPRILVVDNFLSPKECEYFIKLGNGDDLKRSLVMSETEKDSVVSEGRTSHTSFLNNSENIGDIKILEIEKRIAELTMIPVENGERFQVLRYKIGQEYKPHFDYFKKSGLKRAKIKKQGGQRIATVLVYLGEPQSGGETIFPKVNIKIKSKRGRAVFFYNIQTDGSEDELSLHGSMPVEEGEKWTLTKWLRASKNNQR